MLTAHRIETQGSRLWNVNGLFYPLWFVALTVSFLSSEAVAQRDKQRVTFIGQDAEGLEDVSPDEDRTDVSPAPE